MRSNRRKTFADYIRLPQPGGVVTRITESAIEPGIVAVRVGRFSAGRIAAKAAAAIGVREGAAWTIELRERVLGEHVLAKAREHALRIAAARPLTRRQVADKLVQRGTSIPAAREIAEDLAARGVIDEAAMARHLASGELSRGKSGKLLVTVKLRRRGIDAKTAQVAVDEAAADSGVDPREAALELARRKVRTLPRGIDARAGQRRVYAYLARRGFDPETCRTAVGAAFKAIPHGEPRF